MGPQSSARAVRRVLDRLVTGPLVGFVARPRVEGLEHLASLTGPGAHLPQSHESPRRTLVRHALPASIRDRTAIAAAADYFFEGGVLGPIVALATGAFPLGGTEHVRASLERIGRYVDEGWNVIVFPEGTRSMTGQPGDFKSGIGLLATQLGVPILPVAIHGGHRMWPKGARLPRRRGRIVIRFGARSASRPTSRSREATAQIEAAVLGLLGEGPQRVAK